LLECKGAGSPQDAFGGYDSVAYRFPRLRMLCTVIYVNVNSYFEKGV